ncbi:unnamed protein product, partial [Ostreobium quekettii]|eukprot:evm.model.scf_4086.2 EVM.evm.TU.scf_4086.2   scf_4086:5854-7202(+)
MAPPEGRGSAWWRGATSAAADSKFAGCSYRTVVSTQCAITPDEDGNPQRACERIVKRLRECPGRAAEVIERTEESSTEAGYRDAGKDLGRLLPRRFANGDEAVDGAILRSDVGQLYEDFFKVAAEFEQNYVAEGPSARVLQPENPDASNELGDRSRQEPAPDGADSLLGRLFGRRGRKGPDEPSLPTQK